MSAQTHAIPLRPQRTAPVEAAPRRVGALRLVPQRRSSAARTPFVLVVVALLVSGLLGLLLLNTLVAQDSFTLHDLNKQGKALQQREQDLTKQVEALKAPAALAAQATTLGMVAGGPPAFLQLPSGRVLGQPMPGVAPAAPAAPAGSTTWTGPRPTPAPGAAIASKPSTKPTTKPTTTGAQR